MVPDGRNYTITMGTGEDGTQYVRIHETPLAHSRAVRHLVSALTESLAMLKASFQKALRFTSRRA